MTSTEILVIGGGPAGATAATIARQHGRRVTLLEFDRFPRFHVGESLLPGSQRIWERLGVAGELEQLGQTFKYGGEWRLARGSRGADAERISRTQIRFNVVPRGVLSERGHAYQVERAAFDELLLRNAQRQGVEVVEGAQVRRVLMEGDRAVGVEWTDRRSGERRETRAELVLDASGRRSLVASQLGLRHRGTARSTSAVFAHYEGVERAAGIRGGDIVLYLIERGWIWLIPLADGRMSVGLVREEPDWRGRQPQELLDQALREHDFLARHMKGARCVMPARGAYDLPYEARASVGPGWALVGDASFFVDPLLSSGVHVALASGERAGDAAHASLGGDARALPRYERWLGVHRTRVQATVRRLYRLMRYRASIGAFLAVTGRFGPHWDNPYLRRVNAWGLGNFDRYGWWMRGAWLFSDALYRMGQLGALITGRNGWERHASLAAVSEAAPAAPAEDRSPVEPAELASPELVGAERSA